MHAPTHFEDGPWKDVSTETGIRVLELPNFDSFFQFIYRFGENGTDDNYLWRGQRCANWDIVSTLARISKSHHKEIHLERFLKAVRRFSDIKYDASKPEDILALWSLGQHWGLWTPLIDFTLYPYFALFFAFAEHDSAGCDYRAVFALDAHQIPLVNFAITNTLGIEPFKKKLDSPPYESEFASLLLNRFGGLNKEMGAMIRSGFLPDVFKRRICEIEYEQHKRGELRVCGPGLAENTRIHAQGGVHVFTLSDISLEAWVREHQEISKKLGGRPILTKLVIPTKERDSILTNLNKMNVNYLTIYPDFEGAAKHCNLALGQRHLGHNKGY